MSSSVRERIESAASERLAACIREDQRAWVGVDLDGTLFTYDKWVKWNVFGEPVRPMVERVRRWCEQNVTVKIFTARIGVHPEMRCVCKKSGEPFTNRQMKDAIQTHVYLHVGVYLDVTCVKDVHMIELWDDRAVQLVTNTGRTLHDEYESEAAALRGAP